MTRSTLRSVAASAALAGLMLCASPLVLAQEASIHEIYQAAEAGKFIEAQKMMDKVLADHPSSGKAHFVEAELLAKQGKRSEAAAELATAERLSPGLKFAKPEAVQHLRSALGNRAGAVSPATMGLSTPRPAAQAESAAAAPAPFQSAPAPAQRGLPWGTILILGAVILLAFMFFRRKRPTQPGMGAPGSYGANYQGYPQGSQPGYPNAGQPGYPPAPGYGPPAGGMGSGLGSGIVGGLATGAALGAGMVAGQALAHRFTDGNRDDSGNHLGSGGGFGNTPSQPQLDTPPAGYDMGGSDFGLDDSSSWDSGGDSGGGGGSDWD